MIARRPGLPGLPALLRQQAFRRHWSAQTISVFGRFRLLADATDMAGTPHVTVKSGSSGPDR